MDEFGQIYKKISDILAKWDTEYEKMYTMMRDMKKKGEDVKLMPSRHSTFPHKFLEKRIEDIREFRRQHEQLSSVIARVVRMASAGAPSDGVDPVHEVTVAYDSVKEVDCLDLSAEGGQAWEQANKYYQERISLVETQLAARFREQLGSTRSAEEMFKIFSRFNALFFRPHIKSAIREYQTKLMERVKEDIQKLQEVFHDEECMKKSIASSTAAGMPVIGGRILWNKQILKELDFCMTRVADVLGKDWASYREGRRLVFCLMLLQGLSSRRKATVSDRSCSRTTCSKTGARSCSRSKCPPTSGCCWWRSNSVAVGSCST